MQENWLQRYAVLTVNTLFIQGHRCIAGALFTKGIAHSQAPCNPGAPLLQTHMRERAQQLFPSSSLWVSAWGWGQRQVAAGVCVPDKHRTWFCGYWMLLMLL